jgi:hypothetical protein
MVRRSLRRVYLFRGLLLLRRQWWFMKVGHGANFSTLDEIRFGGLKAVEAGAITAFNGSIFDGREALMRNGRSTGASNFIEIRLE